MTTSAVRGALIVAAVVVGALIISNGFPSAGGGVPSGHVTTPATTPPTTPPSPKPGTLQCPAVDGVRVAVENASGAAGLAASTAQRLQKAGYTVDPNTDIGNASTESTTTTVYFRGPANKLLARCLKKKFFKIAGDVQALKGDGGTDPPIAPLVQVAVFVGSDYAAKSG